MRSSIGFRPANPVVCVSCQKPIFVSPSFQHSSTISPSTFAGKIEQADVKVFHLHAGRVDFATHPWRAESPSPAGLSLGQWITSPSCRHS